MTDHEPSLPNRPVLAVTITLIAAVFQLVGLVRYASRIPDDWLGLGLYAGTFVGLLSVAGLLTMRTRDQDPR